jgi:hypothetical protein
MPAVVALHRTACGGVFRQRLRAAVKPTRLIHAAYGELKFRHAFDPTLHGLDWHNSIYG